MDSETYWAKRAVEREAEWHKKCQELIDKELAAYYRQALLHIRDDIAVLYARFVDQNGLTKKAARELLQGDEYRVWRMDIEDYVKRIETTGDAKLLRELNTLAMRSRVTRLDKLFSDTVKELVSLGVKVDDRMLRFLTDAYKDGYYRGLYEIGQKASIRMPVNVLDEKKVESVVRTPWSGKNYSKRLWKDTELLEKELKKTMTAAMHRGLSIDKLSGQLAERMNVGKNVAARLVQTELNYVQNQAALASIKDAGMKYFRFIATLDSRTTVICREHDGRVFSVDDAGVGYNMPPLHVRCRSTIAGTLGALKDKPLGTRIAREEDTGKTYHVPAAMKYEEWKAVYVDKKMSLDEWKSAQHRGKIEVGKMLTLADPMREATGSAEDSNPEEVEALMKELESYGVTLRRPKNEELAYAPGIHSGEPGEAIISEGASYSAWIHEMTHVRDDFKDGWLGFRVIMDVEKTYAREKHAYEQEIKLAKELPEPIRSEMISRLEKNLEEERRVIYHEME